MAVHAHLKNEFTEDENYHNLMKWLKFSFCEDQASATQPPDWSQTINLTGTNLTARLASGIDKVGIWW